MSEISDRYSRIAAGFASRMENVPASRWSAPTPCTEWTVRDLVAHVITTHRRMAALLAGTDPVPVDPEADLRAQWQAVTGAIRDALADEALASTVVSHTFGDQPFESLVSGALCTDTLVHTWDLARATGQDERLDPDAVPRSAEFTATIDAVIRVPGGLAAKVEPAPDADAQTRFLNFCGRQV
ncbi:MAG TPA: TIGR03086 family metal-binding protein [Mycobacteriales bacterium]|nr:TIGR03086 family metal-binding protein [Mycobacteriales bacterium]